jgi:hypothetical protein
VTPAFSVFSIQPAAAVCCTLCVGGDDRFVTAKNYGYVLPVQYGSSEYAMRKILALVTKLHEMRMLSSTFCACTVAMK